MVYVAANLILLGILTYECEKLWRAKKISAETARKSLHFGGGILAAFWPLYLTWPEIQLTITLIVVSIIALRWSGAAKSFFAVERRTLGDVLGPATVGILAFFAPPAILYTLVVLHITFADGLAAIIGKRLGRTNTYTVLGYKKSVAGTLACCLASFIILIVCAILFEPTLHLPVLALIVIPLSVAVIENISVMGIDNTLIAGVVILLGKFFQFY